MKQKVLSAQQQLGVPQKAAKLLPRLLKLGLGWEEAWPLACNTARVAFSLEEPHEPQQVLEGFSLEQIATLTEELLWLEGEEKR